MHARTEPWGKTLRMQKRVWMGLPLSCEIIGKVFIRLWEEKDVLGG